MNDEEFASLLADTQFETAVIPDAEKFLVAAEVEWYAVKMVRRTYLIGGRLYDRLAAMTGLTRPVAVGGTAISFHLHLTPGQKTSFTCPYLWPDIETNGDFS